jgi:MFS family permease
VAAGKSFSLGCRKWMVCLIELFLFDRFPKHRVLLVSVFFMAATLALIPSCTNLAPLVVALAVMGFFMGNIDTIANLSMIQLYEVNVGPFLQVRHLFCA